MKTTNVSLVYFSATYTTRKIVRTVAKQFEGTNSEYDITQNIPKQQITLENTDLLVLGVPVYAGRVPETTLSALHQFKGNDTPAVIVCVYGNRDYDDALLELKDIVENNGFKVISAGAFIAQHSIFPKVGLNRPDEKDIAEIEKFGAQSASLLKSISEVTSLKGVTVKGNNPYKAPGKIPLHPKGNKNCNECGTCVTLCPAQAISADKPRNTDNSKCIVCSRCVVVCPQHARKFGGMLYKPVGWLFTKANSERKEPFTTYASFQ